jgi:hypothetical protein
MLYFILTVLVVGLAMTAMGVGLIFSNRCLRGSCGGPEALNADGESLSCGACSNHKEKAPGEENVSAI